MEWLCLSISLAYLIFFRRIRCSFIISVSVPCIWCTIYIVYTPDDILCTLHIFVMMWRYTIMYILLVVRVNSVEQEYMLHNGTGEKKQPKNHFFEMTMKMETSSVYLLYCERVNTITQNTQKHIFQNCSPK